MPQQLAGATMGTTWSLTWVEGSANIPAGQVQAGIERTLALVNDSMSTYLPDSEISRFNGLAPGTPHRASEGFLEVLEAALDIGQRSGGAYDVTVAPLVDLWGFGPGGPVSTPPTSDAVQGVLERVGQDRLRVDHKAHSVSKQSPVSVDFSSLAKGFAVDEVASWLQQQGIDRFLVEVGGEMRLSGLSGRGDSWRVAIEKPDSDSRSAAVAITVTDRSVATSGDYRNFFEADGKRYSHSIDPRTGYPVAHELVSVTVVHASAMYADAWATALVVLGAERAQAVAQEQGLAVYFIRRVGQGFEHSHTPAFSPYLAEQNPQG